MTTFAGAAAALFIVALWLVVSRRRRGSPYRAALSSSSSRWARKLHTGAVASPTFYEGGWIRFAEPGGRPSELEMLPGYLETVGPHEAGLQIRFIKPDDDRAEITFGRERLDSHAHVELRVPTVSRKHALITVFGSDWTIRNLSAKNAVRVNGDALSGKSPSRALRFGDTIEIGPARFVFRQD